MIYIFIPISSLPTLLPPVFSHPGILQDPSLDNKRLLLVNQTGASSGFPSVTPVPKDENVVTEGAKSDDICAMKTPCVNGGVCRNKDFQDYECDCTATNEFKGRNCEIRHPCGLKDICPTDMECVNDDSDGDASNGYEGYHCEYFSSYYLGNMFSSTFKERDISTSHSNK